MVEVFCPKCKSEMQFPFMICPECRWAAKGETAAKMSISAKEYIQEHPDDEDQLKMVLDMVMKEKKEEYEERTARKRKRQEMGRKISLFYIIFCYLVGIITLFVLYFVFSASSDTSDGFSFMGEVYGGIVCGLFFLILGVILTVLKIALSRK
ncbi:MAG: hypothetical protein ACMUHM_09205 [Thermoplasmatota archaeon]